MTARDPGAWANTMQVLLTRCVRARTQVLATQGDGRYQLKRCRRIPGGGHPGPAAAVTPSVYHKVTSLTGSVITADPALPDAAVDTDPVPRHTVEACGVDLAIRGGGQEEGLCRLLPEPAGAGLPARRDGKIHPGSPDPDGGG